MQTRRPANTQRHPRRRRTRRLRRSNQRHTTRSKPLNPKPVDREQERFFEELDHARILHNVVKQLAPGSAFGDTIGAKLSTLRREQRAAQLRRRRAERLRAQRAGVDHEPINRRQIILRDKSTCWLCNKHCEPNEIHLDHVIPLALGGPHTADNIRVACAQCNIRKAATHPDDLHDVFPTRYSPDQH